jgi:hypothetical protein
VTAAWPQSSLKTQAIRPGPSGPPAQRPCKNPTVTETLTAPGPDRPEQLGPRRGRRPSVVVTVRVTVPDRPYAGTVCRGRARAGGPSSDSAGSPAASESSQCGHVPEAGSGGAPAGRQPESGSPSRPWHDLAECRGWSCACHGQTRTHARARTHKHTNTPAVCRGGLRPRHETLERSAATGSHTHTHTSMHAHSHTSTHARARARAQAHTHTETAAWP